MNLLETFGGRGIGRCRACQLAAMRVAGYTVEEMSGKTGLSAEIIEEFFRWWDRYNDRGDVSIVKAISKETKQAIIAERESTGATYEQLAEKFGTTSRTVCKIINEKKSPPQPEAVADSKDIKGQALQGVEVIGLMQTMLIGVEENFGDAVDIMSLRADSDTASIMFRYGGTAYSVQFGLAF